MQVTLQLLRGSQHELLLQHGGTAFHEPTAATHGGSHRSSSPCTVPNALSGMLLVAALPCWLPAASVAAPVQARIWVPPPSLAGTRRGRDKQPDAPLWSSECLHGPAGASATSHDLLHVLAIVHLAQSLTQPAQQQAGRRSEGTTISPLTVCPSSAGGTSSPRRRSLRSAEGSGLSMWTPQRTSSIWDALSMDAGCTTLFSTSATGSSAATVSTTTPVLASAAATVATGKRDVDGAASMLRASLASSAPPLTLAELVVDEAAGLRAPFQGCAPSPPNVPPMYTVELTIWCAGSDSRAVIERRIQATLEAAVLRDEFRVATLAPALLTTETMSAAHTGNASWGSTLLVSRGSDEAVPAQYFVTVEPMPAKQQREGQSTLVQVEPMHSFTPPSEDVPGSLSLSPLTISNCSTIGQSLFSPRSSCIAERGQPTMQASQVGPLYTSALAAPTFSSAFCPSLLTAFHAMPLTTLDDACERESAAVGARVRCEPADMTPSSEMLSGLRALLASATVDAPSSMTPSAFDFSGDAQTGTLEADAPRFSR
ncbi:MAG: hypothetical protein EOO41_02870, partial [Methanobacteriota archaeon]